jgi:aminoglycoside phosphotransferase (APT) family kinase protein
VIFPYSLKHWSQAVSEYRRILNDHTSTNVLDPETRIGTPLWGFRKRLCADLSNSVQVAEALAAYLEPRLGAGRLSFCSGLSEIPYNWEAHIYRFQLEGERPLPPDFAAPLVLRAYSSSRAIPRARHDFVVQRHLHDLGYPVPAPLLIEDSCDILGGPFLLMPWVPGQTLLEKLRQNFRLFLRVAEQLAVAHLQLHALPTDAFPCRREPFLERGLDEISAMIKDHELESLEVALDWLLAHRPPSPLSPRILHLDFHPVNLIVQDDRIVAVLDWSESDVGDVHADVAMTLVLLRSAPVLTHTIGERVLARPARWALSRRYLRTYGRHDVLDQNLLRYYLALASLKRLVVCGVWLHAGPETTGFKPSSIEYVTSGQIKALERCFQKASGVRARLRSRQNRSSWTRQTW